MLSRSIKKELVKILNASFSGGEFAAEVTPAKDLSHGDYTSSTALKLASRWGVPVRQLAEQLAAELRINKALGKIVNKIEVAGPGFINFWIKESVQWGQLSALTAPRSRNQYQGQTIIVEYSSPNIAKPMHIGHIRSTFIGQALANLYQAMGAKVIKLNHLGDWGTQFGKLLAAYKMWGNKKALQTQPIAEMLRLYVKFHQEIATRPELEKQGQAEFLKLEQGDKTNVRLWNWFRVESLKEFNKVYRRLGVVFTKVIGESFYEPMLLGLIGDLVKRGIATTNPDGSIVVFLDKQNLPPCLIQKSDGASIYATRDLAAVRYRVKTFKPREIIYVVGNEQALHFEQVFAVAQTAGYAPGTALSHVKFGLVLGEDGQKLATREGKIIKLEEVLTEAVERARRILEQKNPGLSARQKKVVAEVVGLGAVKYNDLSQNRLTDITFNWQKMLSLDGNSGPYLQYTYVRLRSILRKAGQRGNKIRTLKTELSVVDSQLLRRLLQYPEAIDRSVQEKGPHLLALYLYELATAVNSYYQQVPVLKADLVIKPVRLQLVKYAADVIKQGLGLLGINVVEKM